MLSSGILRFCMLFVTIPEAETLASQIQDSDNENRTLIILLPPEPLH
jgi:hypothetical protein